MMVTKRDADGRWPGVVQRFLRYVQIDTQSDPNSGSVPSTAKQKDLGRLLVEELERIGITDAWMDAYGYVFATIPSTLPPAQQEQTPVIALLAHMDTSPDESGKGVKPIIHEDYAGGILKLPGDPKVTLDPARQPALLEHIGHDIITSDGTTLLGSDDKAGVAILMQLAEDLHKSEVLHPTIRLCFTIDEEIGRGVEQLDLGELGASIAYTLDGSGTGTLFSETFNAAEAVITIKGVMVHPGYAKGQMVNAVRVLGEFIAALPGTEAPESTDGREGYIHPHTITSGNAGIAQVQLILRDFTEVGLQRRKDLVRTLVRSMKLKYPKASIRLEMRDQYKNMRRYIEDEDPRAISFALKAAEAMGLTMDQQVIRGGTDGARLSELGVPTPNIFDGGYDYHSRFEWNTVQNLELALAYTKALVRYWGDHGQAAPAPGGEGAR